MKIANTSEIRKLDELASSEHGLSEEILMENAGIAVYTVIEKEMGVSGKHFAIFCGTGNNGGDGLVVARKLVSSGASVSIFIIGNMNKLSEGYKKELQRLEGFPAEVFELTHVNRVVELSIEKSCAIIDAIFGIGLKRKIAGLHKEVINEINISCKPVFSVDIPSGINADTGEVMSVAVKATFTVTFGLPKLGLFAYPGAEYVGNLYVSHISFPPNLYESEAIKTELNMPPPLPKRKADSHKGDFGKALFISGSKSYLGAPYLSSYAFLKSGGGLSYLAAPQSIAYLAASKAREVIIFPQEENVHGSLSYGALQNLIELSEKVDLVSIGQGLSLDEETEMLFRDLLKKVAKPVIIDGDGLTFVSHSPEILKERKYPTIITPHIGEFARITSLPIEDVKKHKFELVSETARELNSIIVLKGAFSLISDGGKTYVNLTGNSGMATAGCGDVLDGAIAAFMCAGLSPIVATRTGVFIHGLSGDLKAKEIGEDGLTAKDVLEGLPFAIKYFRKLYYDISEGYYERARII